MATRRGFSTATRWSPWHVRRWRDRRPAAITFPAAVAAAGRSMSTPTGRTTSSPSASCAAPTGQTATGCASCRRRPTAGNATSGRGSRMPASSTTARSTWPSCGRCSTAPAASPCWSDARCGPAVLGRLTATVLRRPEPRATLGRRRLGREPGRPKGASRIGHLVGVRRGSRRRPGHLDRAHRRATPGVRRLQLGGS